MHQLLLLATLLLVDLQPGPHAVGLRFSEESDATLRYRDVLALDRANGGLEAFLTSGGSFVGSSADACSSEG